MGMVGGSDGAFIGAVHRRAAQLDGEIELVCGAFSSDASRSRLAGEALHLHPSRVYDNYSRMMSAESALPADQRMQFVSIVTPNHLHLPVALAAYSAGFHVLSDKPATLNLEQALQLRAAQQQAGFLYGITQTYTGYPMVKEARARVAAGVLGAVRKVVVEYPQGWLATAADEANKQAEWRLDPARAGVSGCMADIGVHAFNLAEYVSGLQVSQLCADLAAVVPGRALDDDGSALLRFDNGARGVLMASQVSVGEENALRLRVYGELGGLEWSQQEPNTLLLKWPDRPVETVRTGGAYLGDLASLNTRTPMGHPEGYIEAFANIYMAFAGQVRAHDAGEDFDARAADCPGIEEAVRGMAFIEAVVAASASDRKWHTFPDCAAQL